MKPRHGITVRHTAQVAHRLSQLPGKCQNIHGHTMTISLSITGELDEQGILGGLDFGSVKKVFRHYIDTNYDHRLLLNKDDPWASLTRAGHYPDDVDEKLPGLVTCEGDPTTERIALWIAEWAEAQFKGSSGIDAVFVEVKETDTNGADCAIHIEE